MTSVDAIVSSHPTYFGVPAEIQDRKPKHFDLDRWQFKAQVQLAENHGKCKCITFTSYMFRIINAAT